MARQRHWRNFGKGGETSFVTTTCLDFVHVFSDAQQADTMTASLAEDCRRTCTKLHAFVVMPHHVHFLATPPDGVPITALVRRIKSNAARRIRPDLCAEVESRFDQQRGLNRHRFWQRSFRSFVVENEKSFYQKCDYIHANPVRAEIVERELEFRWSSFRFYEKGHVTGENELDLDAIIAEFAPHGLQPVSSSTKR